MDGDEAAIVGHYETIREEDRITVGFGRLELLRTQDIDVVLLLGPLYHLTERDDRIAALREARRVVRPGGLVAIAAISRFASLFDGLSQGLIAVARADPE